MHCNLCFVFIVQRKVYKCIAKVQTVLKMDEECKLDEYVKSNISLAVKSLKIADVDL